MMRRRQFLATAGVALACGCNMARGNQCHSCKGEGQTSCYGCKGTGGSRRSRREGDWMVSRWEPCSVCGGKRKIRCSTCKGSGRAIPTNV